MMTSTLGHTICALHRRHVPPSQLCPPYHFHAAHVEASTNSYVGPNRAAVIDFSERTTSEQLRFFQLRTRYSELL